MFDSNYHCFHKWKRGQNQWMILQIQRLQPHPRARCGSWASWRVTDQQLLFIFRHAKRANFGGEESVQILWSRDVPTWILAWNISCANSNFNPLQRPLKATWWYILTIQWNDENCYPLPLLLVSRDVPLNSIICWSLTLKALTGALKRSLTRNNNWHNTRFKENDYFNLITGGQRAKKIRRIMAKWILKFNLCRRK